MMTLKMNAYRERTRQFFTKKRYTGNYPKWQKRILALFLLTVNAFIWTVSYKLLPDMRIIFGESRMVFVNEASALDGARKAPEKAPHEGTGTETNGAVAGENPKGLSLERKILAAFPEDWENAIKVARCESLIDPTRIGDTDLGFFYDGETLGYSYGIFQIRSGGKDNGKVWSRPAKDGVSVHDWEKEMLDPDRNIAEARKIWEESGKNWGKWTCGKNI